MRGHPRVACASPVSAPGGNAGGDQSTSAAETDAPAESQEQGGGDDGTTSEAPALADGPWTGGQGRITVSGGVDWSVDEPITTVVSQSTDGETQLGYNSDDTFVTIWINLTGVPFGASVSAPDFSARGTDDCDVTYTRADDSGIDATFSCAVDDCYNFGLDQPPSDATSLIVEGSLTATL